MSPRKKSPRRIAAENEMMRLRLEQARRQEAAKKVIAQNASSRPGRGGTHVGKSADAVADREFEVKMTAAHHKHDAVKRQRDAAAEIGPKKPKKGSDPSSQVLR